MLAEKELSHGKVIEELQQQLLFEQQATKELQAAMQMKLDEQLHLLTRSALQSQAATLWFLPQEHMLRLGGSVLFGPRLILCSSNIKQISVEQCLVQHQAAGQASNCPAGKNQYCSNSSDHFKRDNDVQHMQRTDGALS